MLINKKIISKTPNKNQFFIDNKTKNNYIILTKDFYLFPNISSGNFHKIKYTKKNPRKNPKINKLNLSEIDIQNIFNDINDSFNDKKEDRDSLVLKISNTERKNELKNKFKTPEKNINDIKKAMKHKKLKIEEKKIFFNYDNRNTAHFSTEKKYDEFTFNQEETKNKNNINSKNNSNGKNMKKILGYDERILKKISDNINKRKYKINLKSINKKNISAINKSYDDIVQKIPKLNLKFIQNLTKSISKSNTNDTIDNTNNSIKLYQRPNYDFDDFEYNNSISLLNKSNDFPFKYKKKKIISYNNKTPDKIINISKNNDLKDISLNSQRISIKKNLYKNLINNINIFDNDKSFVYINNSQIKENNNNNNNLLINLEELMIAGEKLYEIYKAIKRHKNIANICYEFLNFFFNSSLKKQIGNLFLNGELKENIYCINYTLLFIVVIYDYFYIDRLDKGGVSLIEKIFLFVLKAYLMFCKFIIKKTFIQLKNNIWISKLKNMIDQMNINTSDINNYDNMSEVESIIYNTKDIINNLKILLKKYKSQNNELIMNYFIKMSQINYEEIYNFFIDNIKRENYLHKSILNSKFFLPVSKPYININKNSKKYSLILDLENILLYFNKFSGTISLRPGLTSFLKEIKKYYEIIIFTSKDEKYIEPLIKFIEKKEKFFSYKFYIQHNIIINKTFIKDISRIGRSLNKIIMIDNILQNYRNQKNNTIIIKSFFGDDDNDKNLIYLKDILIKIAKNGGDVRKEIEKYKEEIYEKVTSSIYLYNK